MCAAVEFCALTEDDNTILLILPVDHLILRQYAFAAAVKKAADLAVDGFFATFGIEPQSYSGEDVTIRFDETYEEKGEAKNRGRKKASKPKTEGFARPSVFNLSPVLKGQIMADGLAGAAMTGG